MKYSEIQKLSTEEVESKIVEETEMLRKNVFAHSISPIDNPSIIRESRRMIARLKTYSSTLEKEKENNQKKNTNDKKS